MQNDCSLKRISKYYNLETKGTKNMRKFKSNKNHENNECLEFYKQINSEYKENFPQEISFDQLSYKKSEKGSFKEINVQERKESKGSLSALSKYLDSKIKSNNNEKTNTTNINNDVLKQKNEDKNEEIKIIKENEIKQEKNESEICEIKKSQSSLNHLSIAEKEDQKSENIKTKQSEENNEKSILDKSVNYSILMKEKMENCKKESVIKIGPNCALNSTIQKYLSNFHIFADKVNIFKSIKPEFSEKLKLSSVIKLTEKVSIYGLDLNYVSFPNNTNINSNNSNNKSKVLDTINYLPALSIIKLCFKVEESLKKFVNELPSNKCVVKNEVYMNEGFYFFQNGAFLQIVDEEAVFFYADQKGFHSRKPFCMELENLVPKEILDIPIKNFLEDSCFGIIWSPNLAYNEGINSQFIGYYGIKSDENLFEMENLKYNIDFEKFYSSHFTSNNAKKSQNTHYLNLIGILPIKFDNNYFLKNLQDSIISKENVIFLNKLIVSKFY